MGDRMSRFVSVFAAGVAACAFVFGCSADTTAGDKPTCVSGASQACSCTDGAEGAQQCNAAGEYDACVCESGDTGVDVTSTDTGEDTDDHLKWVKFSGLSWLPDGSGFLYSRYDAPPPGQELLRITQR